MGPSSRRWDGFRSRVGSRRARPTIDVGDPIRPGVPVPPLTRAEARDGEFASEKLTAAIVRRGYGEKEHRAYIQARTGDTLEMVSPAVLRDVLKAMTESKTLQEIRARANELTKETLRVPKRGSREDEAYGRCMKESDLKSWEAPGLVHASAEDMHTFFTDLAGDTSLLYLQQRVPHGVRKQKLLETLYAYRVPTHRAMWVVKVIYLSQCKSDIALCKHTWTEDLLAHLFDVVSHQQMESEECETESKYVIGLAHYSIEEDLVTQAKFLSDFLRFTHEQRVAKRSESESSTCDFIRAISPMLRSLVVQASKSHACAVDLVERISWCLQQILKSGKATDRHLVMSLSDTAASVVAANVDAFVAAPRGNGLDVIWNLRHDFKKQNLQLSRRFCEMMDIVDERMRLLKRATHPECIAIHIFTLIELLHKLLDKYNEEDNEESVSTLIQKYITDQEDEESVWKMSVVTCCDWSMDTSGGSAESRLAVVQHFLNVLNTSHSVSVYVLKWIKAKSECRVNPCIDLLSRLLVELLWSKVITLSQLENFVIAEGIVEQPNCSTTRESLSVFRTFVGRIIKSNDEREEKLNGAVIHRLARLFDLVGTDMVDNFVPAGNESASDFPEITTHYRLKTKQEREVFGVLGSVTNANLVSKSEELRRIYANFQNAQSDFYRVVLVSLISNPKQSLLIAEISGKLGQDVVKGLISHVSVEMMGCKNTEAGANIFDSDYWKSLRAEERWDLMLSISTLQLCLLHNIPTNKRSVAQVLIDANISQLSELAGAKNVSHKVLHFWARISTIIPLIGYVFMSVELSDNFSQLILTMLDSFIGKTIIDETDEDRIAESVIGESLIDHLVALFSVVWIGQIPRWAPVMPKMPFREVSSIRQALARSIDSKEITAIVQMRLRRAIGVAPHGTVNQSVNAWKILASGAARPTKKANVDEKAEFWLQGAVRRPGGNLAWENVNAEPKFRS